jgi:glycosyltransferase involved in cell wall biosynthesis
LQELERLNNCLPGVSVVIPNYNHARYLEQRIVSVLQQSYQDFEVIILDDASTDESRTIIDSFVGKDHRITFYPSLQNSGSTFIQWNKGVQLAKADLVWIAESDDVAEPDFLARMVTTHVCNAKVALVYCQSNRMNAAGKITGTWKTFTDDLDQELFGRDFMMKGIDFIEKFLIHKNVIPNASGAVFKKDVYLEVLGADERLKSNSDWLTWLKLLVKHDVAFLAQPLNNFRHHSESVIARFASGTGKNYKERYDLTLRKAFEAFCAASGQKVRPKILQQNKKYQSFDYGNKGLYEFNQGQYMSGLANIVRASISARPTLGYLKRLIKKDYQF